MSKYTKAREIIEKEIQDNAKTADKYFNYCKDMSDNVARKYNYLLQAESLVYTNQLLQLSLKNADFSYCKIMDDNKRYYIREIMLQEPMSCGILQAALSMLLQVWSFLFWSSAWQERKKAVFSPLVILRWASSCF